MEIDFVNSMTNTIHWSLQILLWLVMVLSFLFVKQELNKIQALVKELDQSITGIEKAVATEKTRRLNRKVGN